MNPSTGTFTTMDTYQGSIFDPTSLHKYLYANANPVTYSDPSGYNSADLNEELTVMAVQDVIIDSVKTAGSFALNYYWQFRAAIPAIATAVTGMAAVLCNSPVFTDICSQLASGSMTVSDIQQQIIDTFVSINPTIWDNILQAVNRSGESLQPSNNSGGGSGSSNTNGPDKDPNKYTTHGIERATERNFSDEYVKEIINNWDRRLYQHNREVFIKKVGDGYDLVIRDINTKQIVTCVGGSTKSLPDMNAVYRMLDNNGGWSNLPF